MAKHQCPNCGGFDSYHWMGDWLSRTSTPWIMAILLGGLMAALSQPIWLLFFLGLAGFYTLINVFELIGRPQGAYVCRLCKNDWTPHRSQLIQVRPDLIHSGRLRLDEEEAAAQAAAEEERVREEQRRRYR